MEWVNAHTHLELSGLGALCPDEEPFADWILRLITARAALTPMEYRTAIETAIEGLKAAGTVAVGDISATGHSIAPLFESGLAGVVWVEVLGLDPALAAERLALAQAEIARWRPREGRIRIGLTVHAPYSASAELFRLAAAWCKAEDVPLCVHLAESPAEVEFLRSGTGPLAALNARFAPQVRFQPPGRSPVQYLAQLGVLEARPLLVHMVQTDAADLALIKEYGCAIAHCPRSNDRLSTGRLALEDVVAAGIPVALGTDSLASAPSLDIRDELEYAIERHRGRVGQAELTEMATTGGLAALGLA